jgi:RimJ/RimL family protein N-acetyltransferase
VSMIIGSRVKLREKKLSDARNDYRWQTSTDLVRLDATPPLKISFSQYLLDYTSFLRHPGSTRRVFAIETFYGKHIGNCVYYNIDEAQEEAEMGIMIGDRSYWSKGYGTDVRPGANLSEDTGLEPAGAEMFSKMRFHAVWPLEA